MTPTVRYSGKGDNIEVINRSMVTRVWGKKTRGKQVENTVFRSVKLFCMTLSWWTHECIYQNPQNYVPQRVNSVVRHGLQLIITYQYWLINFLCCFSVVKSRPALCDSIDCNTPGFPVLHHLPEFANSCPLSWQYHPTISSSVPLLLLPSVFCIRIFSNELALDIRWPKYVDYY